VLLFLDLIIPSYRADLIKLFQVGVVWVVTSCSVVVGY
jgi:hypothetical protein